MNTETIQPQTKSLSLLAKQAADQLGVMVDELKDVKDDRRKPTERRYITFALMEKAGYTHQDIADFFKMNRESITKALTKLDSWLKIYADLRGDYSRLLLTIL
ncbi:hypothetical protein J3L18_29530 [Mucilaginibacter gossypii]|uniref:hypothetical protein n=1 Tax=Mucilaginibacter gossypii TaxID=551996 RepID=UPI000DCE1960|nr:MULTISPECIES: hypothetical protein [Mucilaginibacter]QTE37199.1 hypothetical protein J3L18_29530 [Mucilaginibacter gossypii]RAV57162.1 hypothetical protein DIU36_12620 [Mucilaginibacter rubeus]